jgi:transcriptional regulator with XRE-family HTH domain
MKRTESVSAAYKLNTVKEHLQSAEELRFYARDTAMLVVTDAIIRAMEDAGLTRAEMAVRIERSKGFVSQVLNGSRNMTLATLADLLTACDLELKDLVVRRLGEREVSRERLDALLDCDHAVRKAVRAEAGVATPQRVLVVTVPAPSGAVRATPAFA